LIEVKFAVGREFFEWASLFHLPLCTNSPEGCQETRFNFEKYSLKVPRRSRSMLRTFWRTSSRWRRNSDRLAFIGLYLYSYNLQAKKGRLSLLDLGIGYFGVTG